MKSRSFHAAQSALARARRRADELATRMLGRDFEERVAKVQRYAGDFGIDPFGLDPSWAKYAIGVAALFHRFWFRTDVDGIENVPKGRVLLVGPGTAVLRARDPRSVYARYTDGVSGVITVPAP